MVIECPLCFVDVLPMADGKCPACLGDTRKVSAESRCLTKTDLRHGQSDLPNICMVCGSPTERRIRFFEKAKNERYSTQPHQAGGGLGLLITWLFDYVGGKMHQEIEIRTPQCDECKKRKQNLRVQHLDFDRRMVTFVVHRDFARALKVAAKV